MGGKSRKTGSISQALVDRIQHGGSLASAKANPNPTKASSIPDPFGLRVK